MRKDMQKTEKCSNFELLRIISMCGILVLHYFNSYYGGMIQNAVFPEFAWIFSNFVSSFCVPLVNCFVLISGFFLIKNRFFGLRKTVNLLVVTSFYGIISYLIGVVLGTSKFTICNLVFAMFPFFSGYRWFVETYIILILFSPFINIVLTSLSLRSYRMLLCVQIIIFSVWYTIGLSSPVLDDGYGIINFVTLYMIGAYIRIFVFDNSIKLSRRKYFMLYFLCSLITFLLSYYTDSFGYAYITNIIGATALFLCFCNIDDLGYNKVINQISSISFDVYFVHSDINTSNFIFSNLLKGSLFVNSPWMILHLIIVIPCIWMISYVAYFIRIKIFMSSLDQLLNKITIVNSRVDIFQK